MSDMIFGFVTCSRSLWEEGSDDPTEENGWVDVNWNSRQLEESRNYVRPLVELPSDDDDLAEEVIDALNWLPGGAADNGDGTFYAIDNDQPFTEPWNYSYAIHFVRKFRDSDGVWREVSWHPREDGGIDISAK